MIVAGLVTVCVLLSSAIPTSIANSPRSNGVDGQKTTNRYFGSRDPSGVVLNKIRANEDLHDSTMRSRRTGSKMQVQTRVLRKASRLPPTLATTHSRTLRLRNGRSRRHLLRSSRRVQRIGRSYDLASTRLQEIVPIVPDENLVTIEKGAIHIEPMVRLTRSEGILDSIVNTLKNMVSPKKDELGPLVGPVYFPGVGNNVYVRLLEPIQPNTNEIVLRLVTREIAQDSGSALPEANVAKTIEKPIFAGLRTKASTENKVSRVGMAVRSRNARFDWPSNFKMAEIQGAKILPPRKFANSFRAIGAADLGKSERYGQFGRERTGIRSFVEKGTAVPPYETGQSSRFVEVDERPTFPPMTLLPVMNRNTDKGEFAPVTFANSPFYAYPPLKMVERKNDSFVPKRDIGRFYERNEEKSRSNGINLGIRVIPAPNLQISRTTMATARATTELPNGYTKSGPQKMNVESSSESWRPFFPNWVKIENKSRDTRNITEVTSVSFENITQNVPKTDAKAVNDTKNDEGSQKESQKNNNSEITTAKPKDNSRDDESSDVSEDCQEDSDNDYYDDETTEKTDEEMENSTVVITTTEKANLTTEQGN